ncbi:hypothetical protein [Paraburkholderia youngii]|uniref:Uncharacterized protein n=1 Tax=Paraburkholderia youngii TaxID=2782701 RepID=A0A7W8L4X7_9BURK|nr:hypothetical protein [Paraburkholderia youngii]MBB5400537.1 hypothetical protein [Paraburkholderia youngii]
MKRRLMIQLPTILAAMAACSFVSELASRSLHSSIATLKTRPRLRTGIELYLDAVAGEVSAHTRFRNAVDCIYLCCCEVAECHDVCLADIEHPDAMLVQSQTCVMDLPRRDRPAIQNLVMWAASWSPFLPPVSIQEACAFARRVIVATITSLFESSSLPRPSGAARPRLREKP